MQVVFVDIDGVLNCEEYLLSKKGEPFPYEIDETTLPLLKKIVEENDAVVVLISTWRDLVGSDDPEAVMLWQYLNDMLAKYDMSIYNNAPVMGMSRPEEIKAWLDAHPDVNAWVSIEDDSSDEEYVAFGYLDHLVRTYNWGPGRLCGLQECHVKMARDLFSHQRKVG